MRFRLRRAGSAGGRADGDGDRTCPRGWRGDLEGDAGRARSFLPGSSCRLTALFCRIEDVAIPYAYALSCISAPVPGSRQFSHVGRVVARLPTRCSVMNTCARPCLCAEGLFGADKSRGSLLASLRAAPRCPCQGWPSSGLLSLMWPQVPLSVLELLLSRKQQSMMIPLRRGLSALPGIDKIAI